MPTDVAREDRPLVVRKCIAESLSLELGRVQLESNMMGDLGADSLAFLDIVFRIEQEFDIQITRGEMERAARGVMTDEEFAPKGVISEAGLARLRLLLPESADKIKQGLRPGEVLTLFTVQTFLNLVEGKLRGETV